MILKTVPMERYVMWSYTCRYVFIVQTETRNQHCDLFIQQKQLIL